MQVQVIFQTIGFLNLGVKTAHILSSVPNNARVDHYGPAGQDCSPKYANFLFFQPTLTHCLYK